MAGTVIADKLEAASTSTLILKNGVASTPPTVQDSAGTEIGTFCRAWVNFNGTGTVAIRASFNVTSITDNGAGLYVCNLTTAMPDANFCRVVSSSDLTLVDNASGSISTSSTVGIRIINLTGTNTDSAYVSAAIFR